uniref:Uncharacterized protein n=1 Tax=Kalanchoe fedtschenkoi TaxID=63787 RepID=A0A7N0V160_KALFE
MGYRRKRCMSFECGTPRAIVSRWLWGFKSGKEREEGLESGTERKDRRRRRKGGESGGGEEPHATCSTKRLSEELITDSNGDFENHDGGRPVVSVGQSKNDVIFSLGAGFGLALLLASSKSELSKMRELRTQMESLVRNAKDELQSIDKVSKSSKTHRTVEYSTTEVEESMNSNGYFSNTDYTPPSEKLAPMGFHDQDLQHGRRRQVRPLVDRRVMEIELESELKHLQLLCESDGWSKHSPKQNEGCLESTDWGPNAICGEVHQDPHQPLSQEHDGVPPEELALRLHEVLEARQEERIKELEVALQQAMKKLDEKETEASWWKETAQLFSQRLPEVPNPTLRKLSVLPAPHCPKRSIRLSDKLSSDILSKP